MPKVITDEVYKSKVAVIGKVVPLEPYKAAKIKILHKCLIHGETHLAQPSNVLDGRGLLCCKQAGAQDQADRSSAKAAASYNKRLAEIGRAVLVGMYKNTTTKVPHRCLVHNEVHEAVPSQLLRGSGLACCRREAQLIACRKQRDAAARVYQARLAEFGKAELLGDYINARTNTLHLCLIHNEQHLATPDQMIRGCGLKCCLLGGDSPDRFITDRAWAESDCKFYVVLVNGKYIKPGIARSVEARAQKSNGFYGDFLFVSPEMTREKAWAIEQQLLAESAFAKPEYLPAEYDQWDGRTELRLKDQVSADWFINRFNALITELEDNAGYFD